MAEVASVDGFVGNFKVTVKHKPRYIIEDACIGCMECIEACVYKEARVPDEFNLGLGKRKPIYIPFPQAVPQKVVIDPETCIEFKSGKCKKSCVVRREKRHHSHQPERGNHRGGAIFCRPASPASDSQRIP
jgi:heterodisulfide reductase subunit A